ncbi:MAG: hypothetical protein PUF62_02575 [Bacteroidales bacterium]|nr:hypothetical protein [Bacteroidales bacterium]
MIQVNRNVLPRIAIEDDKENGNLSAYNHIVMVYIRIDEEKLVVEQMFICIARSAKDTPNYVQTVGTVGIRLQLS